MKTAYFKKVRVLRYSPELKARALRVNHKDLHSVAEFIIDIFYLHTARPVSKSEFLPVVLGALLVGISPAICYRLPVYKEFPKAFSLAVACGAIKYTPRKHLLPGETE